MYKHLKTSYKQWLGVHKKRQNLAYIPTTIYRGTLTVDSWVANYKQLYAEPVLQNNEHIELVENVKLRQETPPVIATNTQITTKFWRILSAYFFK